MMAGLINAKRRDYDTFYWFENEIKEYDDWHYILRVLEDAVEAFCTNNTINKI